MLKEIHDNIFLKHHPIQILYNNHYQQDFVYKKQLFYHLYQNNQIYYYLQNQHIVEKILDSYETVISKIYEILLMF